MWETAIRSLLLADNDLQALIASRLYPNALPPNVTFPAATYTLVSYASEREHAAARSGRALLQFVAWSPSWLQARAAARAAVSALNAVRVTTPDARLAALPLAERDLMDEELGLHGRAVDFLVYITEE